MRLLKLLGLFALLLTLAACNAVPEPTLEQETVEPDAAAVEPMPTPTLEPQADYCLNCHTDKDQLIQTAKPEEVVESESEGVG